MRDEKEDNHGQQATEAYERPLRVHQRTGGSADDSGGSPLVGMDRPGRPYQANRALDVLSKMMNVAEEWGLRPDGSNPCRHVKKYREVKHERYLTREELQRLGAALMEEHDRRIRQRETTARNALDPRRIAWR
jgi:hypothetical protein